MFYVSCLLRNNLFAATAHGNGVYFAVRAEYSAQPLYSVADGAGNRHMFLCQVLVGHSTKGAGGMKILKDRLPGVPFDSAVDREDSPTMYIIFNDTQAYPDYLITFRNRQ
jgi:poly [ADP-ribose] polymerase 10/14/15